MVVKALSKKIISSIVVSSHDTHMHIVSRIPVIYMEY